MFLIKSTFTSMLSICPSEQNLLVNIVAMVYRVGNYITLVQK